MDVLARREAQIDRRLLIDEVKPRLIITTEVFW